MESLFWVGGFIYNNKTRRKFLSKNFQVSAQTDQLNYVWNVALLKNEQLSFLIGKRTAGYIFVVNQDKW